MRGSSPRMTGQFGMEAHRAPSSTSRLNAGISQPQRQSALERDDLLERFAEIELKVLPLGPAEMGRAEHVGHGQERMVSVGDRLLLVDIDRGKAGPALAQRRQQGTRRD